MASNVVRPVATKTLTLGCREGREAYLALDKFAAYISLAKVAGFRSSLLFQGRLVVNVELYAPERRGRKSTRRTARGRKGATTRRSGSRRGGTRGR
jgi:hypothetical protein